MNLTKNQLSKIYSTLTELFSLTAKNEERITALEMAVSRLIAENSKTKEIAGNVGASQAIIECLLYQEGVVDPGKAAELFKDYQHAKTVNSLNDSFAK